MIIVEILIICSDNIWQIDTPCFECRVETVCNLGIAIEFDLHNSLEL